MQTADGQFRLNWMEIGGSMVKPPARRGFGSIVIEHMAADAVAGDVALDFDPSGLKWQLVAPTKEVVYEGDVLKTGTRAHLLIDVQDETWVPTS